MNRLAWETLLGLFLALIGIFSTANFPIEMSSADDLSDAIPPASVRSDTDRAVAGLAAALQPLVEATSSTSGSSSVSSTVRTEAGSDIDKSLGLIGPAESESTFTEAQRYQLADDPSAAAVSEPWFGILQPSSEELVQVRGAGVAVATLEIAWDRYELSPGAFDAAYVSEILQQYSILRSADFRVILDTGLQYPPSWVFEVDDHSRFVNQYGDEYHGGIGDDVPNAVFSDAVRNAQAAYLHHVASDLIGLEFMAIRVGGLGFGELRYPSAEYGGNRNCYWAFDGNALESSPVSDWGPGDADVANAKGFLDWYLQSLADYGKWLADTTRIEFAETPNLHVLFPSWGIRPGEEDEAVASSLDGTSRGELRQTINQGVDWSRQLIALSDVPGVMASTTWLDAADQGEDSSFESPVAYLARLTEPLGIPILGENTGNNTAVDMERSADRVRELGLVGMLWMRSPHFAVDGLASLGDYEAQISSSMPAQDPIAKLDKCASGCPRRHQPL